ncbi:MAG: hypothetical protein ABI300_06440 [Rhodanobacter sp.]
MKLMTRTPLHDVRVHVRFEQTSLWTSVMYCQIYRNLLRICRPADVQDIREGEGLIGQSSFVACRRRVDRRACREDFSVAGPVAQTGPIVEWGRGSVPTLIGLLSIPGSWASYTFLSVIEVALLAIGYALHWPKQATT